MRHWLVLLALAAVLAWAGTALASPLLKVEVTGAAGKAPAAASPGAMGIFSSYGHSREGFASAADPIAGRAPAARVHRWFAGGHEDVLAYYPGETGVLHVVFIQGDAQNAAAGWWKLTAAGDRDLRAILKAASLTLPDTGGHAALPALGAGALLAAGAALWRAGPQAGAHSRRRALSKRRPAFAQLTTFHQAFT